MNTDDTGFDIGLPPDVLGGCEQIQRGFDQDLITTPGQHAQLLTYMRCWATLMGAEQAMTQVADHATTAILQAMEMEPEAPIPNCVSIAQIIDNLITVTEEPERFGFSYNERLSQAIRDARAASTLLKSTS